MLMVHCCVQMPAGAISMFGPGTKTLLSEGLKKRQPSTSEESEKSEEVGITHLSVYTHDKIKCGVLSNADWNVC